MSKFCKRESQIINNSLLSCYHGPLLYEAKCVRIKKENEYKYFIHYQGWNKNW